MSNHPDSRWLTRSFAAILSIPLRFKITIPYLILALLLAGLATWSVSRSFAQSLEAQFHEQLVVNFATASDDIFQIETSHLVAVRAIAYTAGVAEAVSDRNSAALDSLIRPLVVNAQLPLVHIVDGSGQLLYGLRATPEGYVTDEGTEFVAWAPVQRVLAGESDDLGDKFVGAVEAPWGAALYTAGPVEQAEIRVGAVLVGTPLTEVLARLTGDSLAQVTLFRPDGQVAATTFTGERTLSRLPGDTLAAVNAEGSYRLQNRLLRLGAVDYNEAIGPLLLRGAPSGWLVGVALPRALLAQNAKLSPAQLAGWFTLAVLAMIGVGAVVAQVIAVPVFELVRASSQVAAGQLEVAVPERANDELGLLARHFNRMVHELRQREFMRDLFGRVVSNEVREALLKGQVGLGGELKVVTVLFTDIRQFTTLSESYSPQEVVSVLNSYFTVVTSVIHETGGLVNKFGGDSTLAVFGAPMSAPPAETARKAIQAALSIRTRLAELNAQRVEVGQQPISIGIGINTGEVITGTVGSAERFEYTVIGDTVNIAARVQGLTAQFTDSNILITEATLGALEQHDQILVVDHGEIALKGKARPVRIYGVMGTRLAQAQSALPVENVPRYDILEALYLYCRGFRVTTIALTKKVSPPDVRRWLSSATEHFGIASQELRLAFKLTDTEVQRLHEFSEETPEPDSPVPPASAPFENLSDKVRRPEVLDPLGTRLDMAPGGEAR